MTLPPPTTDEARAFYVDGIGAPSLANGHRFDRWLAAHDAEVRAQALREAADWLDGFEGPGGRTSAHDRAGREIIRLLRARAEQTKETSA